jgi:hypothetical protein
VLWCGRYTPKSALNFSSLPVGFQILIGFDFRLSLTLVQIVFVKSVIFTKVTEFYVLH